MSGNLKKVKVTSDGVPIDLEFDEDLIEYYIEDEDGKEIGLCLNEGKRKVEYYYLNNRTNNSKSERTRNEESNNEEINIYSKNPRNKWLAWNGVFIRFLLVVLAIVIVVSVIQQTFYFYLTIVIVALLLFSVFLYAYVRFSKH